MTTTYHTPITAGAAANAAIVNAPLGQLDAAIAALAGGAAPTMAQQLIAWLPAVEYLTITRNSNEVPTSATIKWPDGSAGTFTATTVNSTFDAVDAYTITHADSGLTVTQAAVTRNSNGSVTAVPALSVA